MAQRFERIGNPARRDPVALGALAERVAGYYRPRLPRHANAIQLSVRAPSAGPVILGDPVLLEWALEAMVKNAIDALAGPRRPDHPGGRGVAVTPRQCASSTTDRACRAKSAGRSSSRASRTKRGGWGIGLALARRVVEDNHQGTLSLEPTSRGTTFLMRFPLAAAAA